LIFYTYDWFDSCPYLFHVVTIFLEVVIKIICFTLSLNITITRFLNCLWRSCKEWLLLFLVLLSTLSLMHIIFCIVPLFYGLLLNLLSRLRVSSVVHGFWLIHLKVGQEPVELRINMQVSIRQVRSRFAKSFRTFSSLRLKKLCWKWGNDL